MDSTNYAYLSGEIEDDNANEIIETIIDINYLKKKPDNFTILINSEGGNISPAFALIDVMQSSEIPIYTHGLGEVCSAAFMILMAGSKGNRSVTKNTSLMSHHCIHYPHEGNHTELQAYFKALKIDTKMMIDHYKEHTGLDKKTIKKKLLKNNDVYLTPKDALKYNVIDKIGGIL